MHEIFVQTSVHKYLFARLYVCMYVCMYVYANDVICMYMCVYKIVKADDELRMTGLMMQIKPLFSSRSSSMSVSLLSSLSGTDVCIGFEQIR